MALHTHVLAWKNFATVIQHFFSKVIVIKKYLDDIQLMRREIWNLKSTVQCSVYTILPNYEIIGSENCFASILIQFNICSNKAFSSFWLPNKLK